MIWAKKPVCRPLFASLLLFTAVSAGESVELEFLEFLAEWQTDDGQWVDPIVFFADESVNQTAKSEEDNQ